ncbi:MAG: hypothetical protein F6K13_19740, partial [Okeania sp. SIO2B9]|nr:hypothetical protein [Okeania sp. SIO2B9]
MTSLAPAGEPTPLGAGLNGVRDYARGRPFVDLVKSAPFFGKVNTPWEPLANVNSAGWP